MEGFFKNCFELFKSYTILQNNLVSNTVDEFKLMNKVAQRSFFYKILQNDLCVILRYIFSGQDIFMVAFCKCLTIGWVVCTKITF